MISVFNVDKDKKKGRKNGTRINLKKKHIFENEVGTVIDYCNVKDSLLKAKISRIVFK